MKKLIIVDDEACLLKTYERILRSTLETAGVEVMLFSGADEVLDEIKKNGMPSLLLTDDNMPGMTGRELASELRQLGFRGAIVMCSGTADSEVLNLGVDVLMEKPFETADLRNTIRSYLV